MEHGEGYAEAGELMTQPHSEIKDFLAKIGLKHLPPGSEWSDEDNDNAIKLGKAIDSINSNANIEPNEIPGLKNLANKEGQKHLPMALAKISGEPGAAKKYIKLMKSRDSGEGRKRSYHVSELVKKVQSGDYSPPILIKGPSGLIVIGGRTRLYAALALGISIKVKILDEDLMKNKLNTINQVQQQKETSLLETLIIEKVLNKLIRTKSSRI